MHLGRALGLPAKRAATEEREGMPFEHKGGLLSDRGELVMWSTDINLHDAVTARTGQVMVDTADAAKVILNLHIPIPKQKETGRCPGGNTTGVPR